MGFLKATPRGHTDDSRPSAFTFANMTVQTDECMSSMTSDIPDELEQAIGCHYMQIIVAATCMWDLS